MTIKFRDQEVEIVEVKARGWMLIRLEDGSEINVRARDLEDVEDVEDDGLKGKIKTRAGKVTRFSLDKYVVSPIKTPSGRKSIDVNDEVAQTLRGLSVDEVYTEVSMIVGIPVHELENRYSHLNPGMQRMNLGNLLRKFLKDQANED